MYDKLACAACRDTFVILLTRQLAICSVSGTYVGDQATGPFSILSVKISTEDELPKDRANYAAGNSNLLWIGISVCLF